MGILNTRNMYGKIIFIYAAMLVFTSKTALLEKVCPIKDGTMKEQNRLSPIVSPKLRLRIDLCGDDSNVHALANGQIRKVISNKSHHTIYLQTNEGIEHRITNLKKVFVNEGEIVSTMSILGSLDTKEPNNFILYSIWQGETELNAKNWIQCNCGK